VELNEMNLIDLMFIRHTEINNAHRENEACFQGDYVSPRMRNK